MQRSISPPTTQRGTTTTKSATNDDGDETTSQLSTSTESAFETRARAGAEGHENASQGTSSTESLDEQAAAAAATRALQDTSSTALFHPQEHQQIGDDSTDDEIERDDMPQVSAPQTTSPFRLNHISDLDDVANWDTVTLHEFLGDPTLESAWLFDYMFNIDYVMAHLAVKAVPAQVKIIHGSWKRDFIREEIDEQKKKYNNLDVRCAFMPEVYGTHHSKMMVLFSKTEGNERVRVIIHTANMIPFDWENMSQGIWLSPWLSKRLQKEDPPGLHAIGSGQRFKVDMLRYLREYKSRTRELVDQLEEFDFSTIRAAFLASAPSKHLLTDAKPKEFTSFGWPGLKQVILAAMNAKQEMEREDYSVVVQVSSIATITENWFNNLKDILHTGGTYSLGQPSTKVVWPTVDDIRNSLSGYASGGSIHLKSEKVTAKKQVAWLRKYFHQWSTSLDDETLADSPQVRIQGDAMRSLAAPHIKTFIRYNKTFEKVAWALLTSANLSYQAWGGPVKDDIVRIASWEVGVMVWPELFQEGEEEIEMVPVFGRDTLNEEIKGAKMKIPFRMPYGLPLRKYADPEKHPFKDEPWLKDETPDSRGLKYIHR